MNKYIVNVYINMQKDIKNMYHIIHNGHFTGVRGKKIQRWLLLLSSFVSLVTMNTHCVKRVQKLIYKIILKLLLFLVKAAWEK